MNVIENAIKDNGREIEAQINKLLGDNSIFSVINSQGFVEYASNEFCTLFDVEIPDILNRLSPLFHNDRNKGLKRNLSTKSLEIGYSWKGNLQVKGQKSKPVWVKTRIVPLQKNLDSTFNFLTIHEDISKLKSELSALKKQSSMYEYIYESVKVGIVIVLDSNGKVIKWNKGAQKSFGYSPFEILGESISKLMGGKLSNIMFTDLLTQIEVEKKVQNEEVLELYCTDREGREFPVEFVISKWRMKRKDYYGVKMLDISKRMSIQNRLHKKTKELELLLYRSAHELNAPFSSAQGLINLIKGENNSSKMNELIHMLEKTINHAKVLSNGLYKSSMIPNGKNFRETIDFNKIIKDVLKLLQNQNGFEHFVVNIDVDSSIVLTSNPNLIFTVFKKLLQNAIKYTYQATGSNSPRIDISVKRKDGSVAIKICDNGKGIRKRDKDRIFEIYYRAEVEKSRCSNGLGLYIVSKIVDSLNGKIEVQSKYHQGSCFTVELPLVK